MGLLSTTSKAVQRKCIGNTFVLALAACIHKSEKDPELRGNVCEYVCRTWEIVTSDRDIEVHFQVPNSDQPHSFVQGWTGAQAQDRASHANQSINVNVNVSS